MNFRTPEIEHAAGERQKMRVRKIGSADELPDRVSEAIRGLSEAIPRLVKFALFF